MKKINKEKQDYETYHFAVWEWAVNLLGGALTGGLVTWLCYRSVLASPLAAAIAAGFIWQRKRTLLEEKKRRLHYHFKDFISALHISLRAGYSVENGVRSARADLEKLYGKEDIMVQELAEIVGQMEFQVPVEQLFLELGRRSQIEDIRTFGEVLLIAKRTGGNLSGVLQDTWRTLCEKIDTRQEIDTVIASKKYEQNLMSIMPAAIILYLRFSFAGFLEQPYGHFTVVVITSVCLAIYAGASVLGRRMIRIEV